MKIIAISGKRGSGKSTMAKAVTTMSNAALMSFAGPLRREIMALGYPHHLVCGKPTAEPMRRLLIAHGMCRRHVNESYWISQLWKDIERAKANGVTMAVIDDLRFWNEAEQLRASGATLVRIGLDDPLWRQQFIPGVDDDKSETDLNQWPDWDYQFSFHKGDIEGIRAAAELVLNGIGNGVQT